jgi:hypothetical protein
MLDVMPDYRPAELIYMRRRLHASLVTHAPSLYSRYRHHRLPPLPTHVARAPELSADALSTVMPHAAVTARVATRNRLRVIKSATAQDIIAALCGKAVLIFDISLISRVSGFRDIDDYGA